MKRPVTYDLPADKFNYQIQLQSQARDESQDPVLHGPKQQWY